MTYHAEAIPEQDDGAAVPEELTDDELNALFAYLWQRTENDDDQ